MFDENLWLYVHEHIAKEFQRGFVVFGTGSGALKTVSILGGFAKDILYFIDNNPKSKVFYGKKVESPDILKQLEKNHLY